MHRPTAAKTILAISSQVSVGRVGTSVISPALTLLEIDCVVLATVLLASRPGLGSLVRHVVPADALGAMLAGLDRDGRLDAVDGILTGYFGDTDQVSAVAARLEPLLRRNPGLPVLVDPVIGDDAQGLFVAQPVAAAIRDRLLPLASIATPNRFELAWLTGTAPAGDDEVARAARALGPGLVVVTSARGDRERIATLAVAGGSTHVAEARRFDGVPNGTGDLFAGLFLADLCRGATAGQALERTVRALERVAEASRGRPWLELAPLRPPVRETTADAPHDARWVAGVDGCRHGWAVVFWDANGREAPRFRRLDRFTDVLGAPENPAIVAVDMPIGLPERTEAGGRGPENAARRHLGPRQSSVFSIPSRRAVYARDYGEACALALQTSTPPRKVSKQGFMLFEKIREIDAVMSPALAGRVFEVHPELALWRLNGGVAMRTPKKIKGRVNPDGLAERRVLLEERGFPPDFFTAPLPAGVGADDRIDAAAAALIAVRLLRGEAQPFPDEPARDEKGLTIAIWA